MVFLCFFFLSFPFLFPPDQDFSVLETPRACQAQDALHCAPQNELGGELPQNAAAAPDRKACGMESHHHGEDLWQHGFKLQEALFALVTFEPARERRCKLLCLSAPYARSPPLSLCPSLFHLSLFSLSVCLSICLSVFLYLGLSLSLSLSFSLSLSSLFSPSALLLLFPAAPLRHFAAFVGGQSHRFAAWRLTRKDTCNNNNNNTNQQQQQQQQQQHQQPQPQQQQQPTTTTATTATATTTTITTTTATTTPTTTTTTTTRTTPTTNNQQQQPQPQPQPQQ